MPEERTYTREDLKSAVSRILDVFEIYDLGYVADLRTLASASLLVFPIGDSGRLEIKPQRSGFLLSARVMNFYLDGDATPIIEIGFGENSYLGYLMFRCCERLKMSPDYSLIVHNLRKNIIYEKPLGSANPRKAKSVLEELLGKL